MKSTSKITIDAREEVLVQLIMKALFKKAKRLKEQPPAPGPQQIGDIVPGVFQDIANKNDFLCPED